MYSIKIKDIVIGEGIPKICVPIVGKTEEEILKAASETGDSPADLVEWRVDWFEEVEKLEQVNEMLLKISNRLGHKPLLFTFRTRKEGGEREISPENYSVINKVAIDSGLVDIVDVELFVGEQVVEDLISYAHTKGVCVVTSNHDFDKTPEEAELLKRLVKMEALGADVLKIAVMPETETDILTLLSATNKAVKEQVKKPVVTMSMGQKGLISRLAGEVFGSAITFGALGTSSAPGQIHAEVLKEVLKTIHGESKGKNLFFIGFMGAGKSTVAKEVAKRMGKQLIEMDEDLVKEAGMSIAEIFEQKGEAYFRDMESRLIERISRKEDCVISCGGGTVLRKENVENMKKSGSIIYLYATAETIYERVKNSSERPILNGNMNIQYIQGLMEKRCDIYEKAADKIVATDGRTLDDICEKILVF